MLYPFANLLLLALALTGLWQLADAARSGHFFAEARRCWAMIFLCEKKRCRLLFWPRFGCIFPA